MSVNKKIARILPTTPGYPSLDKPWKPWAPNMHSNVVTSWWPGRNGTIMRTPRKHGPIRKIIGHQMPHQRHLPCQCHHRGQIVQENGDFTQHPCKCCTSKEGTIEKLIDINRQEQETIHNLEAQNGELLSLFKLLGESSVPDVFSKKTRQSSAPWDPTGYCWTYGYKAKKGRTSKTCKTCGEGHQENATHSNNVGGSKANKNWVAA
ncbi:hypothetical protein ACHAW6_006091 [Cyclotella cf. meneghiniana]